MGRSGVSSSARSIEVQAAGADGMRQDYLVSVVLTWR
jgi:hypothetical protein